MTTCETKHSLQTRHTLGYMFTFECRHCTTRVVVERARLHHALLGKTSAPPPYFTWDVGDRFVGRLMSNIITKD